MNKHVLIDTLKDKNLRLVRPGEDGFDLPFMNEAGKVDSIHVTELTPPEPVIAEVPFSQVKVGQRFYYNSGATTASTRTEDRPTPNVYSGLTNSISDDGVNMFVDPDHMVCLIGQTNG
jgi:hypothetical protein